MYPAQYTIHCQRPNLAIADTQVLNLRLYLPIHILVVQQGAVDTVTLVDTTHSLFYTSTLMMRPVAQTSTSMRVVTGIQDTKM
jgi:hypothetical protein